MTRIKYVTLTRVPEEQRAIIQRGKKEQTINGLRKREDDDGYDQLTFEPEEIVELPETMSPSEYDEYMEGDLDDLPADHLRHQALELTDELYGGEDGGSE